MLRALDLSIRPSVRPSVRLSVIFAYDVAKLSAGTGGVHLSLPHSLTHSLPLHPG